MTQTKTNRKSATFIATPAQEFSGLLTRLCEIIQSARQQVMRAVDDVYMRTFYLLFPIWNALRSELSWTHYRALLRVEDAVARPALATTPRDFIRDPVMLEFLGLPNTGKLLESKLVLPSEDELRAELDREQRLLADAAASDPAPATPKRQGKGNSLA